MIVLQLLANGVLQQLIQPVAYGAALGIHPLAVLVVTIGGGCLFGAAGLILAAPVTSAIVRISADLAKARAKEASEESSPTRRPGAQPDVTASPAVYGRGWAGSRPGRGSGRCGCSSPGSSRSGRVRRVARGAGFDLDSPGAAFVVAALVAAFNAVLPPLIAALRLPFTLALGFVLVLLVDALALVLADDLVPSFGRSTGSASPCSPPS